MKRTLLALLVLFAGVQTADAQDLTYSSLDRRLTAFRGYCPSSQWSTG